MPSLVFASMSAPVWRSHGDLSVTLIACTQCRGVSPSLSYCSHLPPPFFEGHGDLSVTITTLPSAEVCCHRWSLHRCLPPIYEGHGHLSVTSLTCSAELSNYDCPCCSFRP
jgi:hypothetical protein